MMNLFFILINDEFEFSFLRNIFKSRQETDHLLRLESVIEGIAAAQLLTHFLNNHFLQTIKNKNLFYICF